MSAVKLGFLGFSSEVVRTRQWGAIRGRTLTPGKQKRAWRGPRLFRETPALWITAAVNFARRDGGRVTHFYGLEGVHAAHRESSLPKGEIYRAPQFSDPRFSGGHWQQLVRCQCLPERKAPGAVRLLPKQRAKNTRISQRTVCAVLKIPFFDSLSLQIQISWGWVLSPPLSRVRFQ